MSKKVLLSIKPEFAQKILSGEKRFEFRRRVFDHETIETVIVYATQPVGMLVGEFTVRKVISGKPDTVWRRTCHSAGITRSYFRNYFQGRDCAHAIEIADVQVYDPPLNPTKAIGAFVAPQSYCFVYNKITR
jgi:predicted transcriptional regulator